MLADGSSLSQGLSKAWSSNSGNAAISVSELYSDGYHRLLWSFPVAAPGAQWACSHHFLNGKTSVTGLQQVKAIF